MPVIFKVFQLGVSVRGKNSSTKLYWKYGGGDSLANQVQPGELWKPCKPCLTHQDHAVFGRLLFLGHVLHPSSTSLQFWGKCLKLPCHSADLGSDSAWRWRPVSAGSGSHLHVFGLCSWEPRLASDQLEVTSRSWAGKGFGPIIPEQEFRVTWLFTLSATVAEDSRSWRFYDLKFADVTDSTCWNIRLSGFLFKPLNGLSPYFARTP